MKIIKIFLASSNELKREREQFEIEIGRKNKAWHEHGIFLHLDIWEDLSARLSQTRSQDEYNTKIEETDIFVLLAYSKVGMYTEEEFETAFGSFKATNKPFIFTYFKDIDTTPEDSLDLFKNKLKELGHFYTPYTAFDHLWNQFNKELDRLLLDSFTKNEQSNTNTIIQIDNRGATITAQNNTIYNTISYGDKKIKKQLGDIPVNPEVFIGRDNSTKEIHTQLTDKGSLLLLVNGQGGIGKTTLASQYYFEYFEYYTHLIWLFAENGIQNVLLSLALHLQIQFPKQATQEQQLDLIIRKLSELTAPILLVIDNANSLEDLGNSYTTLRKFKNIDILLTSRIEKYKSIPTYKVKHLTKKAANSLFKKYYTSFIDEEQLLLDQLLEAIGYNTLVIELLAKNLNIYNTSLKKRYPLQNLLNDIQDKGLLKLSQSTEVDSDYQKLTKATPETIISVMYDITSLNEEEKTVLSVFSVLPATAILFQDLERFLPTIEDLDNVLLGLSQKGWLEYNTAQQSFKNNPIVAEITREQNKDRISNDIKKLIVILDNSLKCESGIHHIKGDFKDIIKVVSFSETIINYTEYITYDYSILYARLGIFYKIYGSLLVGKKYFSKYLYHNKELYIKNFNNSIFRNRLSFAYSKLGDMYKGLGDLSKAKKNYEESISHREELHLKHSNNADLKNNLAFSYEDLGNLYKQLKNLYKAKEIYEKNISLREELYNKFPLNVSYKERMAIAYSKLGDIHFKLTNHDKSSDFYLKENILLTELYTKHPNNISLKNSLAVSYSRLADLSYAIKNFHKTEEFSLSVLSLRENLYAEDSKNINFKNDLAIAYYKLGALYYYNKNQLLKSLNFIKKSKNIYEELINDFPERVDFKKTYNILLDMLNDLEE